MLTDGRIGTEDIRMALDQVVSQTADTLTVAGAPRSITLVPTFQRGCVPNVIDGFRFPLVVTGASQMPTKLLRRA
jgi:hypothetical protein